MHIKELRRRRKKTGETVTEFEAGKLLVRLTGTYSNEKPFDEFLYAIACQKLTKKLG